MLRIFSDRRDDAADAAWVAADAEAQAAAVQAEIAEKT
jgi:hypothetical protein